MNTVLKKVVKIKLFFIYWIFRKCSLSNKLVHFYIVTIQWARDSVHGYNSNIVLDFRYFLFVYLWWLSWSSRGDHWRFPLLPGWPLRTSPNLTITYQWLEGGLNKKKNRFNCNTFELHIFELTCKYILGNAGNMLFSY